MPELSTQGAVVKEAYEVEPKAFTDALYDQLMAIQAGSMLNNQLLSGSATWLTGLTFQVSPCVYIINGETYTSAAEQVTLGAADVTHPRIDLIAVNIDGTADVVAGTAAADPSKPEIDPNTQVEITFVLVAAGGTTPSGISNTNVYQENVEWTTAVSGVTVDSTDIVSPYAGSNAIGFNAAFNGAYITLTGPSSYSPLAFDRLAFRIKNVVYGTASNVRARIALYATATRVSNWIDIRHNTYGFIGTDTTNYQFIQIPILDFGLNSNNFNRVRIEVAAAGANSLSFYIDDMYFQTGVPVTNTADFALLSAHNVFNKAQGSAIVTLTYAATIAWDTAPSNDFQVTLTGNGAFGAPTNVKPGYVYRLFIYQDGTGNRVPTWNAVFKWRLNVAPILSQAASAVDIIEFIADASGNLHGMLRDTAYNDQYLGQNLQTGTSYTLVAADAGKVIEMNNGSANTLTIPANSSVPFPVNTRIDVYQHGAGQTTVAITTDTLRGDPKIPSQYKMVSLWKRSSTIWVIAGGTT